MREGPDFHLRGSGTTAPGRVEKSGIGHTQVCTCMARVRFPRQCALLHSIFSHLVKPKLERMGLVCLAVRVQRAARKDL